MASRRVSLVGPTSFESRAVATTIGTAPLVSPETVCARRNRRRVDDACHVETGRDQERNHRVTAPGVSGADRPWSHDTVSAASFALCKAGTVDDALTREQLESLVTTLRAEVDRLKEELRQLRRDRHETPPHYL